MKKIMLLSGLAYLAPGLAAAAVTPCMQSDMNGNYVMYQNSVALANLHVGRCEVNVRNGVAEGSCDFTTTANGEIKQGFNGAVSGTASINVNCSASMTLDFNPAPGVTVISTFNMQFSPDKQSFVGLWTNNFGLLGTSAGTRYSPLLPDTTAP